ncbi:MAG: histidinol-phosphate transaminase [Clostridiales bacterium]|nr:histidinol-phosphate transaminase [Clostridiales bacterium]
MSRYMNEKYATLDEYVPGEQPTDMKYIKLNTNESPFKPSPLVYEALNRCEIDKLPLYPDPECGSLTKKLADYYGFDEENIFIGNGSDEVLNFAFMAFCQNGVAFADITYGFYKVFADLHGIETQIIPLKDDFSISADDYKSLGKAVFIANPNAPTGMALSLSDIEKIVASNTNNVVIIDEAYVDFGGESAVNLVKKYDNVLVVRTYSKSRSLAGGRLGFSIGGKEITADLKKLKYSTNPYNINRLTLLAGEASIDDEKYFRDNINKIIENREYTSKELKNMDFEVLPSKTNFVFARSKNIDGERLYKLLKKNGILVRHFNKKRIEDFIRVTIGTKEQMRAFVSKVKFILETEAKNK